MPSDPLKSNKRVWEELCQFPAAGTANTKQPAQRAYKYHIFWGDNPIDAPTPIIEGDASPVPLNKRPCV